MPTDPKTDPWQTDLLDLDTYLERLSVTARPPSVDALGELLMAHRRAFTFDNIDVLLGRHPGISLGAVQEKFLGRGRGGYCFEHATLFAAALQRLGYVVTRLLGRVGDWQESPRTHMVVLATIDGQRWMADPGFGFTFPRPLLLEDGTEDEQDGERYRITLLDDGGYPAWAMSRRRHDGSYEVQHTTDELPVRPVDVAMGHHFTYGREESHFRHRLIISRLHGDGSHTSVAHDGITTRHPDAPTTKRPFGIEELAALLDLLGAPLTDDERPLLTEQVRRVLAAPLVT